MPFVVNQFFIAENTVADKLVQWLHRPFLSSTAETPTAGLCSLVIDTPTTWTSSSNDYEHRLPVYLRSQYAFEPMPLLQINHIPTVMCLRMPLWLMSVRYYNLPWRLGDHEHEQDGWRCADVEPDAPVSWGQDENTTTHIGSKPPTDRDMINSRCLIGLCLLTSALQVISRYNMGCTPYGC